MGIPKQALELEQHSVPPRLGEAYELIRDAWRGGDRDRDLGLHLIFLAWYLVIEPAHLTGIDEKRTPTADLPLMFNEVHDYFAPSIDRDAEMLYVVGLMAQLCPW